MKSSPTIRDVAARAGVSRTAVSMALRNHPRISAKVKTRICALAEKMGYRPDPVVGGLMARLRVPRALRDSEKIAYLTQGDSWKQNVNEAGYFRGARSRAEQLGYGIENFEIGSGGLSPSRLSGVLYTRAIRGIILNPLPGGPGSITLDWAKFAVAALGTTVVSPRLHRATHDYYHGMTLALRSLRERGCRRIGFANDDLFDLRTNRGWLSAFLAHQFEIPKSERIPPFLVRGWEQDRFAERVSAGEFDVGSFPHRDSYLRWIERWLPDAIVSNTDHPYVFAVHAGKKIPRDLAFAQLHRLRIGDPWAGIDRKPEVIGAAAVDLVVSQLIGYETGLPRYPKTITIEGEWAEGPSVPPAERRKKRTARTRGG